MGRWYLSAIADDFIQSARRGNFEFYDINSGAPGFIIDSIGRMGVGGGYNQPFTATFQADALTAATKVLIVKAKASQSANLQEWQNSSSTVLSYIEASGNAFFPNITATGGVLAAKVAGPRLTNR